MKSLLRILLLPFRLIGRFWSMVGAMIFVRQIKPKKSFDRLPTPPELDYGEAESWAVTPERPGKSHLRPKGLEPGEPEDVDPAADVFFIHPTSFFGRDSWNQPPDHRRSREIVDELIIPSEATAFNGSCRIYAPRYRQATLYSFLQGAESSRRALELAYSDIARSFQHYLSEWNQGRPFFVASHSQGSVHAIRLLEEVIDPSETLMAQLVAAYVIGFSFPLDKLPGLQRLAPSEGPDDIGCVVAWDTYLEGHGPNHRLDRGEHWYRDEQGGHWQRRAWKKVLCVNPLTWTRGGEKAASELNRGAVHVKLGRSIPWGRFGGEAPLGLNVTGLSAPLPAEVSARCGDDGYLRISRPKAAAFQLGVLPGGNYHNHDYSLFYMDLRANVAERLAAYLAR